MSKAEKAAAKAAKEAKLTKAMKREAQARTRHVTVTPQKLSGILKRARDNADDK